MTDRETIDDLNRLIGDMRRDRAELFNESQAEIKTLRIALARAVPWLGVVIADNEHLNGVRPPAAVKTMEMAEAALAKTTLPPVPAPKIVIQIQGGTLIELVADGRPDVYLFDWDNISDAPDQAESLAKWPDSFRLAPNTAISPDQSLRAYIRIVISNTVTNKTATFASVGGSESVLTLSGVTPLALVFN